MKKPPKKPRHISQAEWDAINSPALTDAQLSAMRPAADILPEAFLEAIRVKRMGRPPLATPKRAISLRIDADVLEAFKATGAGWQSRINQLLRAHKPSA